MTAAQPIDPAAAFPGVAIDTADGKVRMTAERGELELSFPAPNVVLMRCRGIAQACFAAPLLQQLEPVFDSQQRIFLFADFLELRDFEKGFRDLQIEYMVPRRQQLAQVHLLTRSTLIKIGATVANFALRGLMKVHDSSIAFDEAIRDAARA